MNSPEEVPPSVARPPRSPIRPVAGRLQKRGPAREPGCVVIEANANQEALKFVNKLFHQLYIFDLRSVEHNKNLELHVASVIGVELRGVGSNGGQRDY